MIAPFDKAQQFCIKNCKNGINVTCLSVLITVVLWLVAPYFVQLEFLEKQLVFGRGHLSPSQRT